MNPFKNLTLSRRLFLSLAFLASSMVVIIAVGYHLADLSASRTNEVHDQANRKTVAGLTLAKAYSQDLVSLVDKLESGAYPWSVGLERLAQIRAQIASSLSLLNQPPLDFTETQLLKDIQSRMASGDDFIARLQGILQKGDRPGLRLLSRRMYPCVDPIGFRVHLFLDYELGRARDLVEANRDSFQQSYGWMAVSALAGVLTLFFLVAVYLRDRVSRPLAQLVEGMRGVAQGNGELTHRLEVKGRDEIDQVAEGFNAFIGKLQTVSDMKQDLISVVSHQLKTPVGEINGYIENLLEGLAGQLSPRQKEYLEDMREIGRDNYRLITDLLNVSKLERGVVTVEPKPVPMRHLVELAVRDYDKIVQRKGLSLILEEGEEGLWVFADKDKTVETMRNILNNAVKCTDRGAITLRWGSEGDRGVVEIHDTGIGMTPEVMSRLFSKGRIFGQEAHRAGAGLGLFIGKKFMKLQKGDIRVTSEPGRGSCFALVLPKCRQERKGAA
ncbi:MAG TPA: HAMP domain-containing sensor histidine kinase [bacterium]|nr:HAMP domain-containing sensor histidine kinase [bacterium]